MIPFYYCDGVLCIFILLFWHSSHFQKSCKKSIEKAVCLFSALLIVNTLPHFLQNWLSFYVYFLNHLKIICRIFQYVFLKKLRVFFYIIQVQVAKSEKEHWHNTIASLAAFGPAISFITTTIKTQCWIYWHKYAG